MTMSRWQARGRRGRFTRNTMENTFGLHVETCRNLEVSRDDRPLPVVPVDRTVRRLVWAAGAVLLATALLCLLP